MAVVTRLAREDQRVLDQLAQVGVDCIAKYTPQSTCVKPEYRSRLLFTTRDSTAPENIPAHRFLPSSR